MAATAESNGVDFSVVALYRDPVEAVARTASLSKPAAADAGSKSVLDRVIGSFSKQAEGYREMSAQLASVSRDFYQCHSMDDEAVGACELGARLGVGAEARARSAGDRIGSDRIGRDQRRPGRGHRARSARAAGAGGVRLAGADAAIGSAPRACAPASVRRTRSRARSPWRCATAWIAQARAGGPGADHEQGRDGALRRRRERRVRRVLRLQDGRVPLIDEERTSLRLYCNERRD